MTATSVRDACQQKLGPKCQGGIDKLASVGGPLAKLLAATVKKCTSPDLTEADLEAPAGLRIRCVSALGSDSNRDFHVAFAKTELAAGDAYYNFKRASPPFEEMQGLGVFVKLADGRIAHAYSTYGRGIDVFNGAYQILDLTPKGRDEDGSPDPMFWLKRHDQYKD